eukprot:456489-Pelagomonas_calceolata.AAC.5
MFVARQGGYRECSGSDDAACQGMVFFQTYPCAMMALNRRGADSPHFGRMWLFPCGRCPNVRHAFAQPLQGAQEAGGREGEAAGQDIASGGYRVHGGRGGRRGQASRGGGRRGAAAAGEKLCDLGE